MENNYQFWILIGSQILSVGALFLQLNNKMDSLSREINEIKVEQAKIEGRLSSLENTVRYILDCFPKPKITIHQSEGV